METASPSNLAGVDQSRGRNGRGEPPAVAGARVRQRAGPQPRSSGLAAHLPYAAEARLPLRSGPLLGPHPRPRRRLLHRAGPERGPARATKDSLQVQIKEETRLVSVIDQIDKAVAVIPRGALFKTPFGPIHVNRTFEGLSLSEAKKLSSYFHFREPVELKNKTLLEKADLDPSLDFMDSLEHDIPKGSWSIQMERGNTLVVLRSLLWPGLTFFHAPRTKNCGYIYVGTGEKNIDLPFML
ncbi:radial spoke head protein 9 homolog isoform X2 [Zalophus californianus]|uniref:Radial spoke head protein 9 homolog n=1 Tax=Zalophus californianus TaxID=9704 RepID=A0A6J2DLA6_ZALCA|nr:radial spoke head protein 9 homolog isoform X2 [Zalophus californianus]